MKLWSPVLTVVKRHPLICAYVILCIGLGAFAFRSSQSPRSQSQLQPRPLTTQEKLSIVHDTNVAIGWMENGDYAKAADFFENLIKRLPDEPLGYRNLAIARAAPTCQCRLDPTHFDNALLQDAIEKMLEKDGDSPATKRLASRLYYMLAKQHIDDSVVDKARTCLNACAHDMKESGALYDLYWLEKDADSHANLSEPALTALENAYGRTVANLVVRWELLRVRLAKHELEAARRLADEILAILPEPNDNNAEQLVNDFRDCLNEWPAKADDLVAIANQATTANHAYDREILDLQPSPQSFIVREFSPRFYADLPEPGVARPVPVSFKLSRKTGPPPFAVAVDDVNSDGHLTAVLLYAEGANTRIETVPIHGGVGIEPKSVPGRYTMLKLADLDLDFGKNMESPDLDLILAGPSGIRVLENRFGGDKGRWWVDHTDQMNLPVLSAVERIDVFDVDSDGLLDIVAKVGKRIVFLRNQGDWHFSLINVRPSRYQELKDMLARSNPHNNLGTNLIDYDNDGLADNWLWNEDDDKPLQLFHNEGDSKFTDKTDILPPLPRITSPPVVADIDGDGSQDFVLTTSDGLCYLMNQGGNKNHWLDVRLQSTIQMEMNAGNMPMTNFSGIGCTIDIRSGTHHWRQIVKGGVTHFGLGNVDQIDTVRVAWTNGIVQNLIRPDVDKLITIVQRSR